MAELAKPILLVDDSEDDAVFIKHALAKAVVRNPLLWLRGQAEAIEYLAGGGRYTRTEHPAPCALITELRLGDGDGFTLLEWLRQREEFVRLPKIVLTGQRRPEDQRRVEDLGAWGYFEKPGGLKELIELLKRLNNNWLAEHCAVEEND